MRLDEILNNETLTKDNLISLGAGSLVEWDGDDKGREITPGNGAYVFVTRNFCPSHSKYHSVVFLKNENGYYKPETSKI